MEQLSLFSILIIILIEKFLDWGEVSIGIWAWRTLSYVQTLLNLRSICENDFLADVPKSIKHIFHHIGQEHGPCLLELYRMYIGLVESKSEEIDYFSLL